MLISVLGSGNCTGSSWFCNALKWMQCILGPKAVCSHVSLSPDYREPGLIEVIIPICLSAMRNSHILCIKHLVSKISLVCSWQFWEVFLVFLFQ